MEVTSTSTGPGVDRVLVEVALTPHWLVPPGVQRLNRFGRGGNTFGGFHAVLWTHGIPKLDSVLLLRITGGPEGDHLGASQVGKTGAVLGCRHMSEVIANPAGTVSPTRLEEPRRPPTRVGRLAPYACQNGIPPCRRRQHPSIPPAIILLRIAVLDGWQLASTQVVRTWHIYLSVVTLSHPNMGQRFAGDAVGHDCGRGVEVHGKA